MIDNLDINLLAWLVILLFFENYYCTLIIKSLIQPLQLVPIFCNAKYSTLSYCMSELYKSMHWNEFLLPAFPEKTEVHGDPSVVKGEDNWRLEACTTRRPYSKARILRGEA